MIDIVLIAVLITMINVAFATMVLGQLSRVEDRIQQMLDSKDSVE
jgi:hypothetical protein